MLGPGIITETGTVTATGIVIGTGILARIEIPVNKSILTEILPGSRSILVGDFSDFNALLTYRGHTYLDNLVGTA